MPPRSTILVVEDDAAARHRLRLALESAGHAVVEASSAAGARELLRSLRPSVVIQDLLLPDADGAELARELRRLPGVEDVPILALSGFVPRQDEPRLAGAGFAGHLEKPVEPSRLLEVVEALLPTAPAGPEVLVVDDDPAQLGLARLRLEAAGFRVRVAADGEEALREAERARPDAVLADVLMPRLDGFGLCVAARRSQRLREVPVVLVTANYLAEEDRALAARAGASALVRRTPSFDLAIEEVRRSLAAPAPAGPPEDGPALEAAHRERLMRQLERQVAANAGLSQRCATQAAELSVLGAIAVSLTREREVGATLDRVLSECLEGAGLGFGVLYLVDGGRPRVRAAAGVPAGAGAEELFGQPELMGELLRGEETLALPLPGEGEDAERSRELLRAAGLGSAIVAPLLLGGECLGALLMGSQQRDLSAPDWATFARTVAAQLAQAIGLARAFSAVGASEERFRTLVDSMQEFVLTVGPDLRVSGAHGQAFAREGLEPAALAGRRLTELPLFAGLDEGACARALTGERVEVEWSARMPAGPRHLRATLSPLGDPARGLVALVHDFTEARRLQARLMVADRMASIGTLAAGVAHEINNPLSALLGNLEAALALAPRPGPQADDELGEALRDAREAAQRVRAIVRDLALVARADAGRLRPVDVHRVLESSTRLAWADVRHRARLVTSHAPVPPVLADEALLGQVLLNLLVNAAQALPAGGARGHEIRTATWVDDAGRVVISVRDDGPGLPPEIADRLFTPFLTTRPAGGGAGLGLAISHRIVAGLGGEIAVDSEPGRGCEFRVILPPAPPEPPGEARAAGRS